MNGQAPILVVEDDENHALNPRHFVRSGEDAIKYMGPFVLLEARLRGLNRRIRDRKRQQRLRLAVRAREGR
jgi:hypothetical protein